MQLARFIAMRILLWMLVVMFALTVLFFVPRFGPVDPIEAMLAKVSSQGAYMDASAVDALRGVARPTPSASTARSSASISPSSTACSSPATSGRRSRCTRRRSWS